MLLVAAVSVSIIFVAWPNITLYVLQTRGLNIIVESGTRCLQLIVCLEIVKPYAACYFCQYKK